MTYFEFRVLAWIVLGPFIVAGVALYGLCWALWMLWLLAESFVQAVREDRAARHAA